MGEMLAVATLIFAALLVLGAVRKVVFGVAALFAPLDFGIIAAVLYFVDMQDWMIACLVLAAFFFVANMTIGWYRKRRMRRLGLDRLETAITDIFKDSRRIRGSRR